MKRLQPYMKEYANILARDCMQHSGKGSQSNDTPNSERYRFRIFTNGGTRFEYDEYKWAFEHEFLTDGAAERFAEKYSVENK